MTLSLTEALDLLFRAQKKQIRENIVEFYSDSPRFLRGRTLEQVLEVHDADASNTTEFDWNEGLPTYSFEGHEFKPVKSYGGEGQGDTLYAIYQIDEQYFQKDGYYSSYEGSDWDGEFYEVQPYEVTVTKFKKVKNGR